MEGAVSQVEERPGHGALTRPVELRREGIHFITRKRFRVSGHLNLLRNPNTKDVSPYDGSGVDILERGGRVGIGVAQRLQVIEYGTGGFASHSCVSEQTDAVRPGNALDAGS